MAVEREPGMKRTPMTDERERQTVWLTIAEAADVMRLGRNKLYQLVAEGVIPHRRLGRSIHIHRDIAEHWTPDEVEPAKAIKPVMYREARR
ncbi:MAG: helix-turn-helix domain-containing protein [Chloroflexota bacterium]|nr:helix-turn-helix domain-containing protein [Chloroflexota bacterium]